MDENTKFIAINTCILCGVIAFIVLPDTLFGLFFQLLHLLMEFAHIMFEFIESTLDHLIEHALHTDLHETQVIVFYIIVSVVLVGFYGLWNTVPRVCGRAKNNLLDFWVWEKTTFSFFWLGLNVRQKTIVLTAVAAGFYLLSFLFF
jgi:hypothetical protein